MKNNLFDDINRRWPRRGDRLFAPRRDARFSEITGEQIYRLVRGHKEAGDALVEQARMGLSGGHPGDAASARNLINPAILCYRQYIELALKQIIRQHGPVIGMDAAVAECDLATLWRYFRELLIAYGANKPDDLAVVGRLVAELAAAEASSVTLRVTTRDKADPIPLPSEGIDLDNLLDVMNGVENFLEWADLELNAMKDASPF